MVNPYILNRLIILTAEYWMTECNTNLHTKQMLLVLLYFLFYFNIMTLPRFCDVMTTYLVTVCEYKEQGFFFLVIRHSL